MKPHLQIFVVNDRHLGFLRVVIKSDCSELFQGGGDFGKKGKCTMWLKKKKNIPKKKLCLVRGGQFWNWRCYKYTIFFLLMGLVYFWNRHSYTGCNNYSWPMVYRTHKNDFFLVDLPIFCLSFRLELELLLFFKMSPFL